MELMPGIIGESKFITNSNGVRGEEQKDSHTYRILAIGGSTTECLYLDQLETWPHLLQLTLNQHFQTNNIWVGNVGKSGHSTRHHLVAMRYLPLEEMKIDAIVLLVGINDFTLRLSRQNDDGTIFDVDSESAEMLVDETFGGGNHPRSNDSFVKRTATWAALRNVRRYLFQTGDYGNNQDEVGEVYASWRLHRQEASELRETLPDLSSSLKEYSLNINSIIDIAQEKSVRVIFMTQPTMWKAGLSDQLEDLLWLGGIGNFQIESGNPYYSTESLEKGIALYNDTLLEICRERNVECIDLASLLEKDTSVFYDDVHFNESGARKISEILAKHMLSQASYPIP